MIRELILQMKLGHVHGSYFQRKFGVRRAGAVREGRLVSCRTRAF